MENKLSKAEENALVVAYDCQGTHVELDMDFVKRYLVHGRAEIVTNQEIVMFMNTCKMRGLNPLVSGEVYLIKYTDTEPAQLVVGKDAYLRRAFSNPDYMSKTDGITVVRAGKNIVQKEGCCIYPTEELIGGWCRITYIRGGKERVAFKEVALSEYDKGKSTWRSRPATMINKVAISQCIRDAFPNDYEGIYCEDELVASGVIPSQEEETASEVLVCNEEPTISQEMRQELFGIAKDLFGDEANNTLKQVLTELGHQSTSELKKTDYIAVIDKMNEIDQSRKEAEANNN